jgi:hypothetical protein
MTLGEPIGLLASLCAASRRAQREDAEHGTLGGEHPSWEAALMFAEQIHGTFRVARGQGRVGASNQPQLFLER